MTARRAALVVAVVPGAVLVITLGIVGGAVFGLASALSHAAHEFRNRWRIGGHP